MKGNRKAVFSFVLIILYVGILTVPVHAVSVAPVVEGPVSDASSQTNKPSEKYTTPPAAVFTPETPERAAVPGGSAAATPAAAEALPEKPVEIADEALIVIEDEEVPTAPIFLPQTGGIPACVFYGLGALAMSIGLILGISLKKD